MANSALRTIIIAKKDLNGNEDMVKKDKNDVYEVETNGLTFIALLGIKDVLREEVPGAIAKCKTAGVRVRMVTGDNLLTARAIALECGIIVPEDQDSIVMNGLEFIEKVGGGIFFLIFSINLSLNLIYIALIISKINFSNIILKINNILK